MGPVAIAWQRAGVLLGFGRSRRAGLAQLYGHPQRCRRCHDRSPVEGARARPVRCRRACARPGADVRHLCVPALPSANTMGGAVVDHRSPAHYIAVRLLARDVVARTRQTLTTGASVRQIETGAMIATFPDG